VIYATNHWDGTPGYRPTAVPQPVRRIYHEEAAYIPHGSSQGAYAIVGKKKAENRCIDRLHCCGICTGALGALVH
jgi:hypothetical protein